MLILRLLPRVLVAPAETCIDDRIAMVHVVLVPATDHNRVGAIGGGTRDACLEMPVNTTSSEFRAILKHASDGDPWELTEDWPGHQVLLDQSEVAQASRSYQKRISVR
jgi:hypothetical protein